MKTETPSIKDHAVSIYCNVWDGDEGSPVHIWGWDWYCGENRVCDSGSVKDGLFNEESEPPDFSNIICPGCGLSMGQQMTGKLARVIERKKKFDAFTA